MNIVGLADGAIDLLLENALVNRFNMSEEQVKLYRRFDQPALRTLAQLTLDERVEELLAKKRLPERCFKALTLIMNDISSSDKDFIKERMERCAAWTMVLFVHFGTPFLFSCHAAFFAQNFWLP